MFNLLEDLRSTLALVRWLYSPFPSMATLLDVETWPYGHKTFEYDYRTHTPKLSNQNKLFI
jgi:hypothetical protein